MKLILIGSRKKGSVYAGYFKDDICAICDDEISKAVMLKNEHKLNSKVCDNYNEALNHEGDGIIITTSGFNDMDVFKRALETKKPILFEEPADMAYDSVIRMYEQAKGYPSSIVMGYYLRYTYMYRKILELINNNEIGKVISVEASKISSCNHSCISEDIDLISLIAGSPPEYVSSLGGTDNFVINIEYENKITAVFTFSVYGDFPGRHMTVNGTKGSIRAGFEDQIVRLRRTNSSDTLTYIPSGISDDNGGGNEGLCSFFKKVIKEDIPVNETEASVLSFLITYAGYKSRNEKAVINIRKTD